MSRGNFLLKGCVKLVSILQAAAVPSRGGSTPRTPRAAPTPATATPMAAGSSAASPLTGTAPRPTPTPRRFVIDHHVDQLNSVDGGTYQSLLPQPCVGQFGLIETG